MGSSPVDWRLHSIWPRSWNSRKWRIRYAGMRLVSLSGSSPSHFGLVALEPKDRTRPEQLEFAPRARIRRHCHQGIDLGLAHRTEGWRGEA